MKHSEVVNPVLGDAAATGLYLLLGASAHLRALSAHPLLHSLTNFIENVVDLNI